MDAEPDRSGATVAALATAPGPAGVAVVRVSGLEALAVADALAPGTADQPAGTFRLRRLRDPRDGSLLDEALVLVFRAPRSYTGEDAAELQLHGGRAAPARVLDALFAAGAAPAGPGEFTRRAFLNGKLSLDRAEAVMDLVAARGDRAARAAAEQLAGSLGRALAGAWDALLALCADVEATLDFTEDETPGLLPSPVFDARAAEIEKAFSDLASTARRGRLLREGALVVLAGPANAGKSTLFNALLGADRAIVSPEAGTTRDSIEETLLVGGIPVRLVDTAGLRDAGSGVEGEGIRRARELAGRADVVLRLLGEGETPGTADARTLFVRSKCDLADVPPEGNGALRVSAVTGEGLDALRAALLDKLGEDPATGGELSVSERHAALLREAVRHVADARAAYRAGGEDAAVPAAAGLRAAAEAVGRITGRVYSDDLLDAVFGRFCIGK